MIGKYLITNLILYNKHILLNNSIIKNIGIVLVVKIDFSCFEKHYFNFKKSGINQILIKYFIWCCKLYLTSYIFIFIFKTKNTLYV
jgi:hypothetical protein